MPTYDNTAAIKSFTDATANALAKYPYATTIAKVGDPVTETGLYAALKSSGKTDAEKAIIKNDINVLHDLVMLYLDTESATHKYVTTYTLSVNVGYSKTLTDYKDGTHQFPQNVYFSVLTTGGLFKATSVNKVFTTCPAGTSCTTASDCTAICNFPNSNTDAAKPSLAFMDNFDAIYSAINNEISETPKPPAPSGGDKWIMAYYGQWTCYTTGTSYPIPTQDKTLFSNITHFAYGFGGFNPDGDIGTWDAWADLSNYATYDFMTGPTAYGSGFIKSFWGETPKQGAGQSYQEGMGGGVGNNYGNTLMSDVIGAIDNTEVSGKMPLLQFFRLAYIKKTYNLKTVLSFGGWEYNNGNQLDPTWSGDPKTKGIAPAEAFAMIAADDTKRGQFVSNITNLIKKLKYKMVKASSGKLYPIVWETPSPDDWTKTVTSKMPIDGFSSDWEWDGDAFSLFDGVDIDWEYPSGCDSCSKCITTGAGYCPGRWAPESSSYSAYATLLQDLKTSLGSEYTVSTTIAGDPIPIKELATDVLAAFNSIDRVSIMSYDYMNGNSVITHDAPLTNTKIGAKDWNTDKAVKNLGVSSANINIGIPFYGRFQYVKKSVLEGLNDGAVPTQDTVNNQDFADELFAGTVDGLYSTCTQSENGYPCPWVANSTMGINSVNYQMVAETSAKACFTTGDSNACDFTKMKTNFFEGLHESAQVSFYISKSTVKMDSKAEKFAGEDVYIVLSMPSAKSIAAKGAYINDNSLGGVITWMVSSDVSGTLAKKVRDSINP